MKCDWCGVEFERGKDKINRYDNHFCSKDCKVKWYANVYSQSEEWKKESRQRAVRILQNNMTTTQTKPQVMVNNLLDELHILYENEKNCKYYSIDNYLPDYNLMIEVMGDFWHCSPIKYDKVEKDIHKKVVPRDKAKHTYIRNNYNVEILYLWESDIYNNLDMCKELILLYINNNGELINYNSFNYELENGEIRLKTEIIKPYFESKIA